MLIHIKLIHLLKYQCSLSDTEARACLVAYKENRDFSSEAVNHYGGTKRCIQDAIAARHRLYKIYNGPVETWWTIYAKGI